MALAGLLVLSLIVIGFSVCCIICHRGSPKLLGYSNQDYLRGMDEVASMLTEVQDAIRQASKELTTPSN